MSVTTIIDNEYATLRYHSDKKIVHHTFLKPIAGDAFREILTRGIDLLAEHQAEKWLSDDRGNGPLSEADTEWSMQTWFPKAKAAGWKYWALVVPQNIMAQMNLQEFI